MSDDDGCAQVKNIFQYKRNGPNQNYINLNCDVAFESVIVGNIFENPELLK